MTRTTVEYKASPLQQRNWGLPADADTIAHIAADDHTVEYRGNGFGPDKTIHHYRVGEETYRSYCVERISLLVYRVTYSTDPDFDCEHSSRSMLELVRETIRRRKSE